MNVKIISEDEISNIAAFYTAPNSLQATAKKFCHSIEFIKKVLVQNKISIVNHGVATSSRSHEILPDTVKNIIAFYLVPHSMTDVSKKFNITVYKVRQILSANNISLHSKEVRNELELAKRIETNIVKYGAECSLQNETVWQKRKNTMLDKYGVEFCGQSKELTEKKDNTCLYKYGNKYPSKTEQIKEKTKNTNRQKYGVDYYTQTTEFLDKSKATVMQKYNKEYFIQTDEFKQQSKETCLKKYGVEYSFQSKNNKEKSLLSKKRNNTMTSSSQEEELAKFLTDNNISYLRQYKDIRYPFACDFYINSLDLFIELNLSWVHGHKWFDKNNNIDIAVAKKWKVKSAKSPYFASALDVWINRDPLKLQTALQNNLNYIAIFNLTELEQFKTDILTKYHNIQKTN